jgi:hypothetical protein
MKTRRLYSHPFHNEASVSATEIPHVNAGNKCSGEADYAARYPEELLRAIMWWSSFPVLVENSLVCMITACSRNGRSKAEAGKQGLNSFRKGLLITGRLAVCVYLRRRRRLFVFLLGQEKEEEEEEEEEKLKNECILKLNADHDF